MLKELVMAAKSSGLTERAIAHELGCHQSTINRISAGKCKEIGLSYGIKLIRLVGGVVTIPAGIPEGMEKKTS